jgi:hypothetical protein
MGLADREYMRRKPTRLGHRRLANLIGIAVLLTLVIVGVYFTRDEGPNPRVVPQPLYPREDPWADYLAPESACPGGEDRSAALADQQRTMLCLVNWARRRHGLGPLPESPVLSTAAD